MTAGTEIWDDRNFLNDPLAPVSVPDPTTPGFGGPLAAASKRQAAVRVAGRFPRYDYARSAERRRIAHQHRAEFARLWGAWPALGSYAWFISGAQSATGYPWLGGFPQTGIQTPSIMHFVENRSAEGADHRIAGIGMEFAGSPLILIGQTDSVAYTTTTAQLRLLDTFFEQIVGEDSDSLHYSDEGSPAPLNKRIDTFLGTPPATRTFWRSHERNGNKGSRPIFDFRGDAEGLVESATSTSLTKSGTFAAAFAGGHVAIIDGPGAGQIRSVAAADNDTLTLASTWTTTPTTDSSFVAVKSGNTIIALALDGPVWLEETTTVLGFAAYQRAETILDIRNGVRLIPSTHNFFAADNRPWNSVGTQGGTAGNVGYWSSGFSRRRQGGLDPRLPIDGTQANPLVIATGTVASATGTSLGTSGTPFSGKDFTPPPLNFRYLNPTQQGSEFVVAIVSGSGAKQTRRIASNTASELVIESPWGVTPSAGDGFEVSEIVGMPEAVNPSEGYTANWNNKAATADEGAQFGREFRHSVILEHLAAENAWDRVKQRQLNNDVAGVEGRGKLGRFLIPRLRQAVDGIGNLGNPAVDTVLAALEAHNGSPFFGRLFIDPVTATTVRGEVAFLNNLINRLANDIYGDEYAGAIGVPGGGNAFNLMQHAIDSAAGDLPGGYSQAFSGSYFPGDWRTTVVSSFSALATAGIPADTPRGRSRYRHPLAALSPALEFEPTPAGNRGTYEQIVDVGPVVNGEFIFPLGQSGLIQGDLVSQTVDPNFTSLHPIWRDWRFVPMLHVAQDLATAPSGDTDGDGVLDGYERWYFGDLERNADSDVDRDGSRLVAELAAGSDPTNADTDGDGIADGQDTLGQDRLRSGLLKIQGRIEFGTSPGKDRLVLRLDLGRGGVEFDPTTREIVIILHEGDQIAASFTMGVGSLAPGPAGRKFTFRDPESPTGIRFVQFRVGPENGTSHLELRVEDFDLSRVPRIDHELSVEVRFGTHTATGVAHFLVVRPRLGRIRGPS